MDKILEGILQSDKPEGLKKQMCRKVEDLGRTGHPTPTVLDIFKTTTRLILHTPEQSSVESCKTIYLIWAKNNRSCLESYFTPLVLQSLLDEVVPNQKDAMWVIHETMILIRSNKPEYLQLCAIIEMKAISYIRHFLAFETVNAFCRFLFDFRECIPKGPHRSQFCMSLIASAGTFNAPKTTSLMKIYIRDVTNVVGGLLDFIWKDKNQEIITKSLEQLFSIISYVGAEGLSPSLALAGIVPHIPVNYVESIVKQTVSDSSIPDDNMKVALGRMINWLSWPGAKNLDTWIIAFFRGLASVHKYTILMDVTEAHITEVYQKLDFPVVRDSAFEVLSHMLLSYQLSPEPFHKLVQYVPGTITNLLNERSDQSNRLACRFAQLLHCLMTQHSGFPDLYEPILEAIKNFPRPTSEAISKQLEVSSWKNTEGKGLNVSYNSWTHKSETGKTGLVNLGNTCYMNSVLQCLFMCDSFRHDVLSRKPSKHTLLLLKLQHVFCFLSHSQRAAYAPSSFYNASRPPWFTHGYQQDCSELMRYLYDQLHEEELAAQRASFLSAKEKEESAMEVELNPEEPGPTLIQKTFAGKMVTTFRCLSCHKESAHSEMFTDIPLAFSENVNSKVQSGRSTRSVNQKAAALVGGASSGKSSGGKNGGSGKDEDSKEKVIELEEMLHHFLKPEKLQGDNKYHCDVCKGLRDGERVIRISSAPEYLNLTLLRFAYNVKAKARSKIFSEVSYPKTLRLPVLSAKKSSGAYTGTRGKVKKSKSDVLASHGDFETYALCAVIVHSGYSSDSGHYYCYARHSIPAALDSVTKPSTSLRGSDSSSSLSGMNHTDMDYLQDRWFLMNDSRVTYSSYESFSNVTKNFSKDTAYVLFYKRMPGENELASNTNESMTSSLVDPPLRSDLRAALEQDNKRYLQEQEIQERARRIQESSKLNTTQYYDWKDHDDNGPPGSCGGGGGGGFSTNRLVF